MATLRFPATGLDVGPFRNEPPTDFSRSENERFMRAAWTKCGGNWGASIRS